MFLQKLFLKHNLINLLLVIVIAEFNAKITNSEKAIYFLSLLSCSIKKLKSVFQFYVDSAVLTNDEFEIDCNFIYHHELELKKENEDACIA